MLSNRPTRRLLSALLLASLLFSFAAAPARAAGPSLVPWPQKVEPANGAFTLTQNSRIVADSPALAPLAAILSDELCLATGLRLPTAAGKGANGDIVLAIDPALKGDAQVIEISPDRAWARGANYNAAAMASVTLLQAFAPAGKAISAPAMTIHDQPGSEYCGAMVDIARKFNSIDSLKQVVVLCRLYKIRLLHLHMTDDQLFTFPSKAYPKLGVSGEFKANPGGRPYTPEQLQDLVAFADARGVSIVPEFEMPGHSGALQRAMPEVFGVLDPKTGKRSGAGVINIANDEIYPVLETLINEMCDTFKSSPYFHMGGDECWWPPFLASDEAKQYMQKTGLNHGQLVAKFCSRINEIVKKRGKRLIVWESFGGLDKDIITMAWRGSHQHLIDQGYKIINVPWVPQVYYTPRANYEWNIWMVGPEGCGKPRQMPKTDAVLNGVIGAQMVLWEQSGDKSILLMRLTAPARNEQVYNPTANKTYEDFEARLKVTDVLLDKLILPVRFSVEGLRKADGAPLDGLTDKYGSTDQKWLQRGGNNLFSGELTLKMESLLNQPGQTIHYTLDGTEPTPASPVATAPLKIQPTQKQQDGAAKSLQPQIDITVKARLFAEAKPVGFTRQATYSYNMLDHLPKLYKFSLYQSDKPLSKAPEDLATLKLLYTGPQASMSMGDMRHINFPADLVCIWEGAATIDKDGQYEFKLRSFRATSQLFVDGKLLADRTATDWGDTLAKIQLSAGSHTIKVVRVGGNGYQSLGVKPVGDPNNYKPLKMVPIEPAK